MYQLGEQDFGTAASSGDKVDTDGEIHVSFYLYKEDFAANIWSELLQNPVRITRRLLTEAGWNAGLSKVWGRSFLCNHVKVPAEKCDVIAFQATIKSEDENGLLTHSGVAGPYITSRDPHGRPCNKYRVLWLPDAKPDIQVKAASMNAFGLVRSKTGLGIRVLAEEYVKRYEDLHPGKSAPAHVPVRFRYRLEQIPQGIQTTGLQSWATSLNWAIKIQKWNGPRTAIIGAEHPPPPGVLAINGEPVILHELHFTRKETERVSQMLQPVSKEATPATDILQTNDPWRKSDSVDTRPPLPRRPQPTPSAGPFEAKLKEQENEISSMKKSIAAMSQSHTQFAGRCETEFTRLQTGQDNMRKELNLSLETVMAKSQSSFEELKMLLQANMSHQHHRPAKKAKDCHPGETERMELES